MPTFEPAELAANATYHLLTSIVVPRPIAWVASRGRDGTDNLAPHSYFNVISHDPPIVHFTSTGAKDTLTNVRTAGEFTISIVTESMLGAMNTTAADFPPEVDEFEFAGVDKAGSDTVAPPWVAGAPAALECTVRAVMAMGSGTMVFGDVTRIHVAEEAWIDDRVDPSVLAPVARLSGSRYAMLGELTRLPRPTWAELRPDDR